jgi:hypothetical protein
MEMKHLHADFFGVRDKYRDVFASKSSIKVNDYLGGWFGHTNPSICVFYAAQRE